MAARGVSVQVRSGDLPVSPDRVEAQFTVLRYFTLDGTDQATHKKQGSMIRRNTNWRNRHADDRRLRSVVDRANVA